MITTPSGGLRLPRLAFLSLFSVALGCAADDSATSTGGQGSATGMSAGADTSGGSATPDPSGPLTGSNPEDTSGGPPETSTGILTGSPTGEPTGSPPTTTDDVVTGSEGDAPTSSSTGDVPVDCADLDPDDACQQCLAEDCCSFVEACLEEPTCACALDCWAAGGSLAGCANECDAVMGGSPLPSVLELDECATQECALC